MKDLSWDAAKSEWLKKTRGLGFEEIIEAPFLGVTENQARPGQAMLVFVWKDYLWAVPCVETETGFFLKTMYPSRRLQRLWKSGLLRLS